MSTLRLDHITKSFKGAIAVQDVYLDVHDGEFFVILGPSGCGKTTLLRLIAGLERQSSGSVWVEGNCVDSVPPRHRQVALVAQSFALFPYMTVYDNIAFPLKSIRRTGASIHASVMAVAEQLELETVMQRKPRRLSGGQRQRVALGRALVMQPNIFLMDEPLSSLDPYLRAKTSAELIDLHRGHRTTTLYVTHDQTEAMTMGDRIAVMDDGKLQQIGTPDEIYSRPASVMVARFVGSPEMNLVRGKIGMQEQNVYVHTSLGDVSIDAHGFGVHDGQEVFIGIRAEDLKIQPATTETSFQGTVQSVVNLGYALIVHVDCSGQNLTLRAEPDSIIAIGDIVPLLSTPNRLHLFDAITHLSVRHATSMGL